MARHEHLIKFTISSVASGLVSRSVECFGAAECFGPAIILIPTIENSNSS